jgi:hypothetical protein
MSVTKDGHTVGRCADLHTLHVAQDGHTQLCQAIANQHFALPLGSAAPMTAHRGHKEGLRAPCQERFHQWSDDFADGGDAAAAHAYSHAHTRFDARLQPGRGKLACYMGRHINYLVGGEALAHRGKIWKLGHGLVPTAIKTLGIHSARAAGAWRHPEYITRAKKIRVQVASWRKIGQDRTMAANSQRQSRLIA